MATKTNTTIHGKEYYRITRTIDGKKKQFYGSSKSDAEDQYKKFIEKRAEDMYREAYILDTATFSDRAEEFINEALKPSAKYAEGTKTAYISAYNTHVKGSSISKMVAAEIKARDIQKFYNELDVSQQTLRRVHKFMSAIYKWMVRNTYAYDVLSAVEIPKKTDNSRHDDIVVWTDKEIHTILDNLDDSRLRFLVYTLLYTGMRISEALGLKYKDFDKEVVHIRRQRYKGELKAPKANSVRDIPLHSELKREFERHKEWHWGEMKKRKYKTEFVFTTQNGFPVDTRNLHRALSRYYDKIGVEHKHTHAYRSTFCTQLCKCGVQLEVASKLLGHKSIEVTAKHYALVQPKTQKDAIKKLVY